MRAAFLLILVALLLAQQPARRRDLGPFAWDDDVMQELRAVQAEHKQMLSQISVNTQRLSDIERRLGEHEHTNEDATIKERVAKLEASVNLMLAIGVATLGCLVSYAIWAVKSMRRLHRLQLTLARSASVAENSESG